MRIFRLSTAAACFLLALGLGQAAAQDPRAADHEELRAMLRTVTKAMNDKDLASLAAVMLPDVSITTVDQQRFKTLADFQKYWNAIFGGPTMQVRKVTMTPQVDDLTQFLDDSTGLAYGSSTDTWEFADGDVRTMKIRWSAVMRKAEGKWKIASVHVGTNLLDNPVLDATKAMAWKIAAGVGVGGLVVGFLIGWLSRRRPARTRA
jgi:uncharacterized protein (TIGR02246 family)